MKGKRCLLTGATAGIGEVAAIRLAALGYDVVIVGRDERRCQSSLERMKATQGGGDLAYLVADLSSREAVVKLARSYKEKFDRLDILINNAGAVFFDDRRSVDGLEMTWALNHFGYFWLTNELIDLIRNSSPARIINVSSDAHKRSRLSLDTLIDKSNKVPYFTYGNSKLANILFTTELARRLESDGVTVNALHPGMVATRFGTNNGIPGQIFNLVTGVFSITSEEGAKTVVYLATSPEVESVTGKYFYKEKEAKPSRVALDGDLAQQLWRKSELETNAIDELRKVSV